MPIHSDENIVVIIRELRVAITDFRVNLGQNNSETEQVANFTDKMLGFTTRLENWCYDSARALLDF